MALLKMLLGIPFPARQRATSSGTCRAILPAFCSLSSSAHAPALPAPAPHTQLADLRSACHVSHVALRTQSQGAAAHSLWVFAPTNIGKMRSQPLCGGGHLHACFMHASCMTAGVTCPPVTRILVQYHTDVIASRRPEGQAKSHPSPILEHSTSSESRPPQGCTCSGGAQPCLCADTPSRRAGEAGHSCQQAEGVQCEE